VTLPYEGDELEPLPCGRSPVLPDGKCVTHTSYPENTWFRSRLVRNGSELEGYARRNRAQEGLWNFIPDEDEEVVVEASKLTFLEAIE
jgi:hypothetical protein